MSWSHIWRQLEAQPHRTPLTLIPTSPWWVAALLRLCPHSKTWGLLVVLLDLDQHVYKWVDGGRHPSQHMGDDVDWGHLHLVIQKHRTNIRGMSKWGKDRILSTSSWSTLCPLFYASSGSASLSVWMHGPGFWSCRDSIVFLVVFIVRNSRVARRLQLLVVRKAKEIELLRRLAVKLLDCAGEGFLISRPRVPHLSISGGKIIPRNPEDDNHKGDVSFGVNAGIVFEHPMMTYLMMVTATMLIRLAATLP